MISTWRGKKGKDPICNIKINYFAIKVNIFSLSTLKKNIENHKYISIFITMY